MFQSQFLTKLKERAELEALRLKTWRPLNRLMDGKDEKGQTTMEYVMIIGLIAAVIMTIFTVILWPYVNVAVTNLANKIANAISGGGISAR